MSLHNCLATQQAIAAANRELIAHFEVKIKTALDRGWGEDAHEPLGETA